MRRGTLLASLVFQLVQTVGFALVSLWMLEERQGLNGHLAQLQLACILGSALLSALALRTLAALLLERPRFALYARRSISGYVQTMIAALLLGLAALQIHASGRPALTAFAVALSLWLLALGFDTFPRAWLSNRGFLEHLGRRTALSDLEWFELRRVQGQPVRLALVAGSARAVKLRIRLAAQDPAEITAHLKSAGLSDRLA